MNNLDKINKNNKKTKGHRRKLEKNKPIFSLLCRRMNLYDFKKINMKRNQLYFRLTILILACVVIFMLLFRWSNFIQFVDFHMISLLPAVNTINARSLFCQQNHGCQRQRDGRSVQLKFLYPFLLW